MTATVTDLFCGAGGSSEGAREAGLTIELAANQGEAITVEQPIGTVPTKDRWALVDTDTVVDDCGFRMLEPHEIAAAMAFPEGYIPTEGLTKRDRVKLAGNAVTPPVMTWISGRVLQALEAAG